MEPPEWLVEEHRALRLAMDRLRRKRPLCEDCLTKDAWLIFDPVACCWKVQVRHAQSCPVLLSPHSRWACDEYIRGFLSFYGQLYADYCNPDFEHERVCS